MVSADVGRMGLHRFKVRLFTVIVSQLLTKDAVAISTMYVVKAARFHLTNPHIVGTYIKQEDTAEPKPAV